MLDTAAIVRPLDAEITAPAQAIRPYRLFGSFRFLLALLVAVQHFGGELVPLPTKHWLAPLAPGNVAVMVFFVMSGFIIFEARASFYSGRPAAFLLNRSLRIVPPFVAAVGLSILVQYGLFHAFPDAHRPGVLVEPTAFSPANIVANLLGFIPDLDALGLRPSYEFFAFAWSIRVEFLFYLLVFAGMSAEVALRRWKVLPAWPPMPALAALMLLLFVAWRLGLSMPGANYVQYVPYFVFGASLYGSYAGHQGAKVLCVITAPMLFWHFHDYEDIWFPYGKNTTAQLALLALLLTTLSILPALRVGKDRARLDSRVGDLSYPLYLNHPLLGAVLGTLASLPSHALGIIALSFSIALAFVMFHAIEPTFSRIRTSIRGAAVG